MIEMMVIVILILVLFGVLANTLGVDSSASSTDPRRPESPVGIS